MQLYSLQFVIFLAALLAVYYALGRWVGRGQWIALLVGSLGFYAATGIHNMLFILFTATTTWLVGLAFGKLEERSKQARAQAADRKEKKAIKARFGRRKWYVLLAAMLVNFGVLAYVKYWNVLLDGLGMGDSFLASSLLLPLGISFYTFQSVGYLIDCYNGKFPPEGNYAKYLLFVSFFPQLIQGPINRYDHMATQLYERHRFSLHQARRSLLLIGFGCMKKFMIADMLSGIVNICLDGWTIQTTGVIIEPGLDPSTPGCVIVFAILLYTIQQYGDFSGGIDMVRGVGHLFGIDMADNFRQPYFSVSLADFWRRWHITLGAWMRDYVFYPLAVHKSMLRLNKWGTAHLGKHVGRTLSACIGNIVVFLLVGLWHGAETHYILWGLYNGVVIAASDMMRPAFAALGRKLHVNLESHGYHVFAILRTFLLVNIGRYFDRFTDFGDCLQAFYNTLFHFDAGQFMTWMTAHPLFDLRITLVMAGIGCIIVFIVSFNRERGCDVAARFLTWNGALRAVIYIFVGALVVFSFAYSGSAGEFLYANF